MRKIKLYLDGIVNSINAQNDNCLHIAKFIDKSRFEVRTLTCYSGELPIERIEGVKYFHVGYPARIWNPIKIILGILWCDVAYLPPIPGHWKMARWLTRVLRKPAIQTVEGIYEGVALERAETAIGPVETIKSFHRFSGHTYSIAQRMVEKNRKLIGLDFADKILHLGVDSAYFKATPKLEKLTDVLMIGADLYRKGLKDYLELARRFPQITFHVAGGNIGDVDYGREIAETGLKNVIFHGKQSHEQLKGLFAKVQLHIFPSHYESFGKVTFEAAAAGIPSVVYDDYGATEWITSATADEVKKIGQGEGREKSGFVVRKLDDMANVIQALLDNPSALQPLSNGARAMAERWDWRIVVKEWEREIESLVVSR